MKREVMFYIKPGYCCPGHDKYPSDTYKNNRSKKQRSKGIKKEHRFSRRKSKYLLKIEVFNLD